MEVMVGERNLVLLLMEATEHLELFRSANHQFARVQWEEKQQLLEDARRLIEKR